jgi:hypothetical protein
MNEEDNNQPEVLGNDLGFRQRDAHGIRFIQQLLHRIEDSEIQAILQEETSGETHK